MRPRLTLVALAAALAAAGLSPAAQGQTPAAAGSPPAPAQDISVVTVLGKLTKRPPATVRRLDRRSASSCAFDFNGTAQAMLDDYLDHFHGKGRTNDGSEAELAVEGDAPKEQAFSDTSPLGDASRDGNTQQFEEPGQPGGCRQSDYTAAAGRNYIARKDKSLDQAYALFDKRDFGAALEGFKASYKKVGWPEAALMVGDMYLQGQGTGANPAEAAAWYTKLAGERRKDADMSIYDPKKPEASTPKADAHLRLARLYLEGVGVAKDPKAARVQYQRADELNFIPARHMLGRMLLMGYGGPADVEGAIKLLINAGEHGYAPSQWTLARVYDAGTGVARDPARAFAWYGKAAFNPAPDDRRPHALVALARMLDTGDGAPADQAKALAMYKAAAIAGHPAAQNALATYFYEGGPVAKDAALARKLFIAAANQGDRDAMTNAGVMLFKGEGGGADPVQSYIWLRLAERLGNTGATAMAKLVEKRLTAQQREQAEAVLKPQGKG